MSDAATTFHRVISDRHFFSRSLISATVAAIVSAVLLAGIVLCIGGIAQLVVQGRDVDGLVAAATRSAEFPANLVGRAVASCSLLHESRSALATLFALLAGLVIVRFLLRTFVERKISHRAGVGVNRLREHIQRQALRSNPGDLTGAQRAHAATLFHETAQRLEESARSWGVQRLTSACDLVVLVLIILMIQWKVGIECLVPILVSWYVARVEAERHDASAHLLHTPHCSE